MQAGNDSLSAIRVNGPSINTRPLPHLVIEVRHVQQINDDLFQGATYRWQLMQQEQNRISRGIAIGLGGSIGLLTAASFSFLSWYTQSRLGFFSSTLEGYFAGAPLVLASFVLNGRIGYQVQRDNALIMINAIRDAWAGEVSALRNISRFIFDVSIDGVGVFLSVVFAQSIVFSVMMSMRHMEIPIDVNESSELITRIVLNIMRSVVVFASWHKAVRRLMAGMGLRLSFQGRIAESIRDVLDLRTHNFLNQLDGRVKSGELESVREQFVSLVQAINHHDWRALFQVINFSDAEPSDLARINLPGRACNLSHLSRMGARGDEIIEFIAKNKLQAALAGILLSTALALGIFYTIGQKPSTITGTQDSFAVNQEAATIMFYVAAPCITFFGADWAYLGLSAAAERIQQGQYFRLLFGLVIAGTSAFPGAAIAMIGDSPTWLVILMAVASCLMNLAAVYGLMNSKHKDLSSVMEVRKARVYAEQIKALIEPLQASYRSHYQWSGLQMRALADLADIPVDHAPEEAMLLTEGVVPMPRAMRLLAHNYQDFVDDIESFHQPAVLGQPKSSPSATGTGPVVSPTGVQVRVTGGALLRHGHSTSDDSDAGADGKVASAAADNGGDFLRIGMDEAGELVVHAPADAHVALKNGTSTVVIPTPRAARTPGAPALRHFRQTTYGTASLLSAAGLSEPDKPKSEMGSINP